MAAIWAPYAKKTGIRFRPKNMPLWDMSNGDPPSVRHDCFELERLFVVPWGDGRGEVGIKNGDETRQKYEPGVSFNGDSDIMIWDRENRRLLDYDYSGRLISTTKNVLQKPDDILPSDKNSKYLSMEDAEVSASLSPIDYGRTYDNRLVIGVSENTDAGSFEISVVDLKNKKLLGRAYLPPTSEAGIWGYPDTPEAEKAEQATEAKRGDDYYGPHGMSPADFDQEARNSLEPVKPWIVGDAVIYHHCTNEGLEIFRYRNRCK